MRTQLPMMMNVLAQADSLDEVVRYQREEGAAALEACAAVLRGAVGRIFVSGMGASLHAVVPAAAMLARAGRPVQLAESAELLHFGEGSWGRGDVAVLISRSGGSVEVLRVAEVMRAAGVRVVCVTNLPGSPLTELADETLLLHSGADQLIAVQSYSATVLATLLLAERVGVPGGVSLGEAWCAARANYAAFVTGTIAESEGWGEFLAGDEPMYLLGRGEALAAVHEGALLFHETAKLPAIGMSSGQFRHGPVEAMAEGRRVILLGSPARTRALDERLAQDLLLMGARVRWIGPTAGGTPASLGSWPDGVPAELAPLFDVVPLQVAAYRAALERGIVPGDFRFASEVTGQETGFPLLEGALR